MKRPQKGVGKKGRALTLRSGERWWRFQWTRWGCKLVNSWLGTCGPAAGYSTKRKRGTTMPKKPSGDPLNPGTLKLPDHDLGSWGGVYPELCEYLTARSWPDGEPRKLSKLFIDTDGALWRATLKEPNFCYQIQVTGKAPDDLLLALEIALTLDTPPWSIDQWAVDNQKKKRK